MEKDKIVAQLLSHPWPSQDELVLFAAGRRGFGGDDGYYGVTYPGDLDDYDRANGHSIPQGMVELSYWDGEIKEILIAEREYLTLLADHLEKEAFPQLARKIRGLTGSAVDQLKE